MSVDREYTRRRRYTHDTFDFPRESEHRVDPHHRRGSLCDRYCVLNMQGDLVDTHSGSHQHSLLTPRLLPGAPSTPACCPHHSEEVQPCNICLKTTITAENEVEAHKLSNNYKFGFKKWKSHVTERRWEDRSDIVKELYSELNVVKTSVDSTLTFGNILYLLLFGWWISLFYLIISVVMFISIVGFPYGVLCWRLAIFFVWPFGKIIWQVDDCNAEVVLCCYYAINVYYYKYSVDGLNVFAVNLIVLVIVSLVLGYVDSHNYYTSSPVKFTLSLVSIMPLSYYIGMAIASISAQSNFALGAVVNATFGSIIELTFYITALIKGARENDKCYEEVVKSALTGTLLGCVLLVPGLCMVIGGIKHREQRFNSRSAGVGSALLFISVGGMFAPTLFSKVYGKMICAECMNFGQNGTEKYICQNCHSELIGQNGTAFYSDITPLVYTVSILLPAAYVIGLLFTLKTHSHIYDIHISDCHVPGHQHSPVVHWSRWRAVVILIGSTLLMSACADLATEHISPILKGATVSQYFIGVTIIALIPELPEIVNGIQFALLNNLSLSIEIGSCIAVQVCMLQMPILVLFSVFYPSGFTLIFSDLHLWACMFSVILMNYIFMDGKCDYFQGTVLVIVYLILLAMYFFAPSPVGC
ncbi:uncharacterized protein LOC143775827 isoform X2 [Ranitomeya variabilis]|uniref:uncharacterized protein LOC143775827 isoform X2 n=1 Tax=Ranitomeya variabilis TaxID=490064 RepID=UPI004055D40A